MPPVMVEFIVASAAIDTERFLSRRQLLIFGRAPMSQREIGDSAERLVCSEVFCPKCKRGKLRRLPRNFECIDVICSFCGYVAQVKAHAVRDWETESVSRLPGATWRTQKERLEAGIYYPLFVVLYFRKKPFRTRPIKILYLPVDFQVPMIFQPRRTQGHGSRRFDYVFDIRTKQLFLLIWEVTLVEENGRIRVVEVSEGAFSQLPGEKTFPFRRI